MDYKELIENLKAWDEEYIAPDCGEGNLQCEHFCLPDKDCLVTQAATAITDLLARAEAAEARAEKAERAIAELMGISPQERITTCFGHPLDRVMELVKADRDGRCVVLPCQVGTTVYMPFCDEIVENRIGQFHINGYTNPRIWADIDCDWATTQRVRWDLSFGKTVFLTREAAEAALKGERDA